MRVAPAVAFCFTSQASLDYFIKNFRPPFMIARKKMVSSTFNFFFMLLDSSNCASKQKIQPNTC